MLCVRSSGVWAAEKNRLYKLNRLYNYNTIIMKQLLKKINVFGLGLILVGGGVLITQNSFKTAAAFENYGQFTDPTVSGVAIQGDWYQEGSIPVPGYLFVCNSLLENECTFDFENDPNIDPSSPVLKSDDGEFKLTTTP
jgi:hypothetical protein